MGVYDQAARYAAQAEPEAVVARLRPEVGLALTFRRWFSTRTVPLPGGPDRDADLVAVADDPAAMERPWLLIFEFQAQPDAEKAKAVHLEALVFLCHAKDSDRGGSGLLPLPVFVHLTPNQPPSGVAVRTPTGRGFSGDPVVWDVPGDSAAETLARVASDEASWGAMFWIPLMPGADEADIIAEWKRLLDEKVPESSRGDVKYIAEVFAELAGRWTAWNRVVGGVTMTESAVANRMIELGEMRMGRESLLRAIRFRFPEIVTPDVERAIADQPSLPLLREWNEAVFTVNTADEFLAILRR